MVGGVDAQGVACGRKTVHRMLIRLMKVEK
jgi:hypothetical protein